MLLHLREVEEAAEDVLSRKQEIVDLDRRRNANREALWALEKRAKSDWKGADAKTWITLSNCFIKLPTSTAADMLRKDQVSLDTEVNKLRSDLKVKVNELHDKEGKPALKGFGLTALNREEMAAVREVIGPKPR